jgi:hypothetical protein
MVLVKHSDDLQTAALEKMKSTTDFGITMRMNHGIAKIMHKKMANSV